jgi:hypothetical protein
MSRKIAGTNFNSSDSDNPTSSTAYKRSRKREIHQILKPSFLQTFLNFRNGF